MEHLIPINTLQNRAVAAIQERFRLLGITLDERKALEMYREHFLVGSGLDAAFVEDTVTLIEYRNYERRHPGR